MFSNIIMIEIIYATIRSVVSKTKNTFNIALIYND